MVNKKPTYRIEKISDEIRKIIAEGLREVKNPTISSAFVSITSVSITNDMSLARVFYSILNGEPTTIEKVLDSTTGFFRSLVAKELNLRKTPEIHFIYDNTSAEAERIEQLLKKIKNEQ